MVIIMIKHIDEKKLDLIINVGFFKNIFFPISAVVCLALSVCFYKTIDYFFVFLHPEKTLYETPLQEMWRDFAASLIDYSIKFGLSTAVFFATYIASIAILIFVFCRNKR